jgi:hypothetical protein
VLRFSRQAATEQPIGGVAAWAAVAAVVAGEEAKVGAAASMATVAAAAAAWEEARVAAAGSLPLVRAVAAEVAKVAAVLAQAQSPARA